MKKKIWLIPVVIIFIIIMLISSFFVGIWVNGMTASIGRILITANEDHILLKNDMPISLSNRTQNQSLFEGLTDGDMVLVVHDGIAESYPAQSGATAVVKLQDGSIDDISRITLDGLVALGWWHYQDVVPTEPTATEETRPIELEETEVTTPATDPTPESEPQIEFPTEPQIAPYQSQMVWTNAVNEDVLLSTIINDAVLLEGNKHLPLIRFDDLVDLNNFKEEFCNIFTMDDSDESILSFNDVTSTMDELYFNDYVVFVVYLKVNDDFGQYDVEYIDQRGQTLTINICQIDETEVTTEMESGRFIIISVDRDIANRYVKFVAQWSELH